MPLRKSHGIALLTALWVMAMLLILLGGFAALTRGEVETARNFGELTRARWAARAGIRQAETTVAQVVAESYTDLGGSRMILDSPSDEATLGNATYEVSLEDEAGKLNLNTASPVALGAFFDRAVVDAIVDWRDTDSEPEEQGAEDEYYLALTPPYHCKNAPFNTVRELLLVKGMTPELLASPVTEDGCTLEDLLTVSSQDDNTDAEGQTRLNIRTATEAQLTDRCDDVLAAEDITAIIAQRTASAFTTPADLLRVPNLKRGMVARIYDRLTGTSERMRPGLVNLNTAPLEVLSALPGMDEITAQAIVQYREKQGAFTNVGDLLLIDRVSDTAFTRIADLCTTRSRRFRAVAVGQLPDGITTSITCLLQADAGNNPVIRRLYWQE